jgi:predicted class III extradiol MEMO1 family dioxygenase
MNLLNMQCKFGRYEQSNQIKDADDSQVSYASAVVFTVA